MMSVDFRRVCLFYKVLALLSGCPSLCTLDPSPGDAEHPQPSPTQAHGSAHIKWHYRGPAWGDHLWEEKLCGSYQGFFRPAPSHQVRWFLAQVLQRSRTPQCAGSEGLGHLSSGTLPGAEAHPLPTQGLSGIQFTGLGKLWHVFTGKLWPSFPPCPHSSCMTGVFQHGLASLLQGTHSTSHISTCRDQLTQSFHFWGTLKTKQQTPKILIDQVAKGEDVQPGERAIAESSSSFPCSSKNHLFVWVMVASREHQCRAKRRQLWRK